MREAVGLDEDRAVCGRPTIRTPETLAPRAPLVHDSGAEENTR
jgi:hypothetical protein